jgi:hypothetical protein
MGTLPLDLQEPFDLMAARGGQVGKLWALVKEGADMKA